jgi:hypothetical protein
MPRSTSLALLGGRRLEGRFAPGPTLTHVALIGGVSLDLRDAELPPGGLTVTKVSAVGGVDVVVPRGVQVEVRGFSLIGGKDVEREAGVAPGAPVVRIRAFGLVGGVRVRLA